MSAEMKVRSVAVVAASAALCWPTAAVAQSAATDDPTVVETVQSGSIQAEFSYRPLGDNRYENLWLEIIRGGQLALESPVEVKWCEEPYCMPVGNMAKSAVRVADLEGDDDPEVLIDLYTGGAHCCHTTALWRWDGERYSKSERGWGDTGYRLVDLGSDGRMEFRSADSRFAYRFSAFAFSRFPLRILRFEAGRFRDVTRVFPAEIRKDRARQWREYRRMRAKRWPSLGALAAWAADRYRLGQRRGTLRVLRRMRRSGRLGTRADTDRGRFVEELDGFLRRLRYHR